MELRESVTEDDVANAVKLIEEATFKAAVDPVTGKIDMQALRTGRKNSIASPVTGKIDMQVLRTGRENE
jgi:DNA replicative helicase MCM subunit Mcm2 (Cdc46/Mcm family)